MGEDATFDYFFIAAVGIVPDGIQSRKEGKGVVVYTHTQKPKRKTEERAARKAKKEQIRQDKGDDEKTDIVVMLTVPLDLI